MSGSHSFQHVGQPKDFFNCHFKSYPRKLHDEENRIYGKSSATPSHQAPVSAARVFLQEPKSCYFLVVALVADSTDSKDLKAAGLCV